MPFISQISRSQQIHENNGHKYLNGNLVYGIISTEADPGFAKGGWTMASTPSTSLQRGPGARAPGGSRGRAPDAPGGGSGGLQKGQKLRI